MRRSRNSVRKLLIGRSNQEPALVLLICNAIGSWSNEPRLLELDVTRALELQQSNDVVVIHAAAVSSPSANLYGRPPVRAPHAWS